MKITVANGDIAAIATGWRETILLCRKCSKKLNGGFGKKGKYTLHEVLRTVLRERNQHRQIRLMETGCFGICPQAAVTVARSSTPHQLLIVGAATDPAVVLDHHAPNHAARRSGLAALPPA